MWWSVKIKNQGIGEAEIKIQQNNTFKGSRRCEQKNLCLIRMDAEYICL